MENNTVKSKITPDFLNSSFNERMILGLGSQGMSLRAQNGPKEKKTPDSCFHGTTPLWWFSIITYSSETWEEQRYKDRAEKQENQ